VLAVLYAHAPPDIWQKASPPKFTVEQLTHPVMTFGQYLEGVPVRIFHTSSDPLDVIGRHERMEQIAHGIYENS
jgi:hypothetical protein